MILFKPVDIIYKLSGVMMTCMLLAGYGVAISSVVYTSKSKCSDSALGKVNKANAIIFFVIGSLNLLVAHVIIWIPICSSKGANSSQAVSPANDSTVQALNN
jgi:hypothetical protein